MPSVLSSSVNLNPNIELPSATSMVSLADSLSSDASSVSSCTSTETATTPPVTATNNVNNDYYPTGGGGTLLGKPDIIMVGLQEVIDLESRRMAAKAVLHQNDHKHALETGGAWSGLNEKVSGAYRRWWEVLGREVRRMGYSVAGVEVGDENGKGEGEDEVGRGEGYAPTHTESLVGLLSIVFVRDGLRASVKDISTASVKRGMGGRYGNKGGIASRLVVDDTSICWINCHLAAGQRHVRQRNGDVAGLLEAGGLFVPSDGETRGLAYAGGGDGSMVMDHEVVIVSLPSMNFGGRSCR